MKIIERKIVPDLLARLVQGPNLLQIVVGPRQVGKTMALKQVLKKWSGPSHFATADLPQAPDTYWIEAQWRVARELRKTHKKPVLLVLDEVQKISRWGEVIKALFDEDRHRKPYLRVVLLGSAALQIQKNSQESLAGRFEKHYCSHWTWPECRKAFGWDFETWLYFGGYPGGAPLSSSRDQWAAYITDSLIDSVLAKDVLQMTPIVKPALLRQLFVLAMHSPAQILSYNKMLGQLQDAGNTVTLAHYLKLLDSAYLVSGLQKWSRGTTREKASSPKLIVWNNALISAMTRETPATLRQRGDLWGRWVENAVGAALVNELNSSAELYYWRDGRDEVDFVLERKGKMFFIEVTASSRHANRGLDTLKKKHPDATAMVIGPGGIPLETFFNSPALTWF